MEETEEDFFDLYRKGYVPIISKGRFSSTRMSFTDVAQRGNEKIPKDKQLLFNYIEKFIEYHYHLFGNCHKNYVFEKLAYLIKGLNIKGLNIKGLKEPKE